MTFTAATSISSVVDALCEANQELLGSAEAGHQALPSRDAVRQLLADLQVALFPRHFGGVRIDRANLPYLVGHVLGRALGQLERECAIALRFGGEADEPRSAARAAEIVGAFAERLPRVRALLATDAQAAFDGDPAATSPDEAVFTYPGFAAILHHRIAHELHVLGVPLIARIVSETAHASTGVDIHPGALIGESFFIDHGTGVVVGETCRLGNRVRLYQGVTLGAKSFPTDEDGRLVKGLDRHPIVEDDVIVYAGATVLGRIRIGKGSRIGGNVWLTHSVPPSSNVSQAQVRQQTFDGGEGI
jgi:serine O-acetyltransferase